MFILRPTVGKKNLIAAKAVARRMRPLPGKTPPSSCRVKINGIYQRIVKPKMVHPRDVLKNIESFFAVIVSFRGELVVANGGKVLTAKTVDELAAKVQQLFPETVAVVKPKKTKEAPRVGDVSGAVVPEFEEIDDLGPTELLEEPKFDEPVVETKDNRDPESADKQDPEPLDQEALDAQTPEPEMNELNRLCSVDEAVAYSGYKESHILKLAKDDKIDGVWGDGSLYLNVASFKKYLEDKNRELADPSVLD